MSSAGKASRQVPTTPQLSRVSRLPATCHTTPPVCRKSWLAAALQCSRPTESSSQLSISTDALSPFLAACKPPKWAHSGRHPGRMQGPELARSSGSDASAQPSTLLHNPRRCTDSRKILNSTQLDSAASRVQYQAATQRGMSAVLRMNQHAGPAIPVRDRDLPACLTLHHTNRFDLQDLARSYHTHMHPVTNQPCPVI